MRPPALPKSCSRLTRLFQCDTFAIDSWRCVGEDTPERHEEWSPEDRVVVTRRGAWELAVKGKSVRADPVTAILWNRGPYRVRHPVGGGDACTVFRLTASGARAMHEHAAARGARPDASAVAARSRAIDGRSYLLHRRAFAHAARAGGRGDPLAVEEPGVAFLRRLSAPGMEPETAVASAEARRCVDRARDVIARDFRQPLSLADIAREAQCSPFHLGRLFRRGTGITLYAAVVRLRLREGLERLLDEPGRVASVALAVGFASHSHFTDAFRAEFGCPPSQARRLLAGTGRRGTGA
jgi:AraC-like DNA-binding protein